MFQNIMTTFRLPLMSRCVAQNFRVRARSGRQVLHNNTVTLGQSQEAGWRSFSHQIVDGSDATYKPTPFQRKVLVWTKAYKADTEIPEKIKRAQMKKAMDKFRVKASIYMVGGTLVFAAIMAFIGRKSRHEGVSVKSIAIEKREKMLAEHRREEEAKNK